MAENISQLNEKNFDSFISKGNVVVDFYAEWCGPCKTLSPEIEKVSKKSGGKVKFGKVDVDGNQNIAGRFQVMSVPTVIFFKDNEQVERFSGALSADEIEKKIDECF